MHRDAGFYRGAARVAVRLGVPVVFAQNLQQGPGRYAVRFHLLSDTPAELGEEALLEAYVRLAEACIREQPATYLWSNRRWRRSRPAQGGIDEGPGKPAAGEAA
jgi:KDO2-lipid IV(A) lauroyltransferase